MPGPPNLPKRGSPPPDVPKKGDIFDVDLARGTSVRMPILRITGLDGNEVSVTVGGAARMEVWLNLPDGSKVMGDVVIQYHSVRHPDGDPVIKVEPRLTVAPKDDIPKPKGEWEGSVVSR
jgi:hypothetical protein